MGFLDKLGEAAGKQVRKTQEKLERIQEYKYDYECCDDEELFKMLKKCSDQEKKLAIQMVLRDRGYGNNNKTD